ncbi:transmembrane protein 106B-like [Sinocyclocheilus anshuiensis]|uniref:Transmembrane protein 106B-like n=1 Tax=Sinocyclocheilus anshuiensis TaxID=1608454 RepID=A0A671MPS2_9TELE|nr:PREDICTED: transmembrane protein 106B-like [Sinocyclocheilus anshuiensis]XP_016313950.1 PREDICTED: transmembrane protein 106B-like [Sinocyclocheilus anshuiensis]
MSQNKHGEKRRLSKWLDYGSINGEGQTDPCPTCQGTGRIPRGQENQLVAVIPCSDQRLKPHHTKLYVFISVGLCLLICSLILFFLFPRSMDMSAVELKSSMVYFTPDKVKMVITHEMNLTNQNFVSITADNLSVQSFVFETVVGNNKFPNVTILPPRSQKKIKFIADIVIEDSGLNNYCKSRSIQIHTLFLHLQLTIKVSYLSHSEQMSTDAYEYIDCGVNSTVPHYFPLL